MGSGCREVRVSGWKCLVRQGQLRGEHKRQVFKCPTLAPLGDQMDIPKVWGDRVKTVIHQRTAVGIL